MLRSCQLNWGSDTLCLTKGESLQTLWVWPQFSSFQPNVVWICAPGHPPKLQDAVTPHDPNSMSRRVFIILRNNQDVWKCDSPQAEPNCRKPSKHRTFNSLANRFSTTPWSQSKQVAFYGDLRDHMPRKMVTLFPLLLSVLCCVFLCCFLCLFFAFFSLQGQTFWSMNERNSKTNKTKQTMGSNVKLHWPWECQVNPNPIDTYCL